MTDYEAVARPGEGQPGKARPVKDYTLKPGAAYLYNEGDLHSPRRGGPTRLIRIEGKNMGEGCGASRTSASPSGPNLTLDTHLSSSRARESGAPRPANTVPATTPGPPFGGERRGREMGTHPFGSHPTG